MKPLKDLAGQTVIYGLTSFVGRFVNYLLVPVYTYTFSTGEYGNVTLLYSFAAFLNIVLTYGMETSLFNFSRIEENKQKVYSTILLTVFLSSCFFLAIFFALSNHLAAWVKIPEHPEYIEWFGIILCSDALSSIAFAKLRQMNKAKKFASMKALNIFLYIVFNLFFILLCPAIYKHPDSPFYSIIKYVYNPSIGVGYIFLSNVYSSVLTLIIQLPDMFKAGFNYDSKLLKTILPYTMPLLFAGLAGMVNETLDRILLRYLLPHDIAAQQIGIYGACYKIAMLMTMFVQAFRYAAEPYFFSHAKDKDFNSTFSLVNKYFIIFCLFIFLVTMLNISWIQHFVGPAFRSGINVVPILLLANLCLGVFYNLSMWYKLEHKTLYGAYLTIFGAIITIALNIYWIPRIGFLGSAWATLICYAATMVASYFMSRKYAQWTVKFDLKSIGIYFILSLVLYLASTQIKIDSRFLNLIFNNALILVFVAIVYLIEKPKITQIKI